MRCVGNAPRRRERAKKDAKKKKWLSFYYLFESLRVFTAHDLTCASLHAAVYWWMKAAAMQAIMVTADGLTCYVEPTHVGAPLAEMPLVLSSTHYVNVPLEQTFAAAYTAMPRRWKDVIEAKTR
jgi:hypothetical protein